MDVVEREEIHVPDVDVPLVAGGIHLAEVKDVVITLSLFKPIYGWFKSLCFFFFIISGCATVSAFGGRRGSSGFRLESV